MNALLRRSQIVLDYPAREHTVTACAGGVAAVVVPATAARALMLSEAARGVRGTGRALDDAALTRVRGDRRVVSLLACLLQR